MMTTMMSVGCNQGFHPFALSELDQLRIIKLRFSLSLVISIFLLNQKLHGH